MKEMTQWLAWRDAPPTIEEVRAGRVWWWARIVRKFIPPRSGDVLPPQVVRVWEDAPQDPGTIYATTTWGTNYPVAGTGIIVAGTDIIAWAPLAPPSEDGERNATCDRHMAELDQSDRAEVELQRARKLEALHELGALRAEVTGYRAAGAGLVPPLGEDVDRDALLVRAVAAQQSAVVAKRAALQEANELRAANEKLKAQIEREREEFGAMVRAVSSPSISGSADAVEAMMIAQDERDAIAAKYQRLLRRMVELRQEYSRMFDLRLKWYVRRAFVLELQRDRLLEQLARERACQRPERKAA